MADPERPPNGFNWSLPFNLGSFRGNGPVALMALVVVMQAVALAALLWVNYRGFQAIHEEQAAVRTAYAAEMKTMTQQHTDLYEGTRAIVYVLTLPPEQRAKLLQRLEVPAMLRGGARPGSP